LRKQKKKSKKRYKSKYIRGRPIAIILPLHKCQGDDISPGRLRAAAEWRN